MGEMAQEATPSTAADGQEPLPVEGQEPAEVVEEKKAPEAKTFDEKYVRELRKQAAEARTRANEAESKLQEIADRDKSETEKLTEKASTAETRAQEAESKLLRYEIAAERNLDLKAVRFLAGSTREEIEASADELAALLADQAKTTTPSLDGGARITPEKRGTPEEEHNSFLLEALGRKT